MLAMSNLGAGCSGAALALVVAGLAAGVVGPEFCVLAFPAFFVDFKSGFCGVGCGDWAIATLVVSNSIATKDKADLCNRYLRILKIISSAKTCHCIRRIERKDVGIHP